MPDTRSIFDGAEMAEDWKAAVPPVLMTLGAVSLLRTSRLLSLALAGALLYDLACAHDDARARARRGSSKRKAEARMDEAIAESFPASDPPAY